MTRTVTILVVIALTALVGLSVPLAGCDDDGGGAACTEADANKCVEDYMACIPTDVMADTYAADTEACLNSFCSCIDDKGCDLPDGYQCGS